VFEGESVNEKGLKRLSIKKDKDQDENVEENKEK